MSLLTYILDIFRSQNRTIKRCIDPAFGEMRLNAVDVWSTRIVFPPGGEEISVHVFEASENGPSNWQQECYRELTRRYPELRRAMTVPLWTEYEEIRKSWELKSLPLSNPDDIWSVAHLVAIEIYAEDSKSGIDISFDHQIDWENEDHDLNVRIKNWQVIEVAMEG